MKVIADIGSNWNTLDDCFNAVDACKESGIDIVKFQYFTHEKLYGFPGKMKGELPKKWIPLIHKHCVEVGIEFMCSVFDPDDVEFLDPFVTMHKIASSENDYLKLIRAIEATAKPYLISMGCKSDDRDCTTREIPMACIPEYPTSSYPIEQLVRLAQQAIKVDRGYGLSDHNPSEYGYELASRFGCSYYEFHFNPLKIKGPDSAHSRTTFTKKEFPEYDRKEGRKFLRPYPKAD